MSNDPRCWRAPGWVWRSWRGSVLVMGPDGQAHQLDGAAAVVWRDLEAPGTVHELVDRSPDVWADAPGMPSELAAEALGALAAAGMVRSEPGDEAPG